MLKRCQAVLGVCAGRAHIVPIQCRFLAQSDGPRRAIALRSQRPEHRPQNSANVCRVCTSSSGPTRTVSGQFWPNSDRFGPTLINIWHNMVEFCGRRPEILRKMLLSTLLFFVIFVQCSDQLGPARTDVGQFWSKSVRCQHWSNTWSNFAAGARAFLGNCS